MLSSRDENETNQRDLEREGGLLLIALGILVFTNSSGRVSQWGPLIELRAP